MVRTKAWWPLAWAALVLPLAALVALPRPSQGGELSREQQIAEVQRQIEELTRRLQALQKEASTSAKSPPGSIPAAWVSGLHWRCIGPATMGGRITAFSVYEADPTTYWVASASGGLLKTVNNGVTFEHQFDHEATVSIGDVCVAPSNKNVVWVGTGEANPRNSVSYGDGVYKSTDGGKTWKNMGLKGAFQVGKVVVHPKDPNTVYVGALGRLYGPNEERGLFKTSDGGKTWQHVLKIDDRTGVIDVAMSPADPETLIVATWERQRDGFDSHVGEPGVADGDDPYDPAKKWAPGTGLWKTTDGGKTFHKLTAGLPAVAMGRIGLSWYRKDPKVVFAIIDTEKIGLGLPATPTYLGVQGADAPGGGARIKEVTPNSPAAKAGLKSGDVVSMLDKKEVKTYDGLVKEVTGHKAGDKVTLKVKRDRETLPLKVELARRPAKAATEPPARPPIDFSGADTPQGVRVTAVPAQGPSARAGLKVGDVVQEVAGVKVLAYKQLVDVVGQPKVGDATTLKVLRGTEVKEVKLAGLPSRRRGFRSNRPTAFWYGGQRENLQDSQGPGGQEFGGVYRSADGGETWARVNSVNPRPMYFSQVRVDPNDEKYIYVLGILMYRSTDGGKTFAMQGADRVHPDQHALWIDPKDSRHLILGCDGGFYVSYDRAATWDYMCQVAIGQFYHVAVDSRRPYRVYGGLQDNGSWGGPSRTLDGQGPLNDDWYSVFGGDGFVCRVDNTDPDLVYFEAQDGFMGRRNLRTGEFRLIHPFVSEDGKGYRYNWNTPFILSHHNPRLFYCGGNVVFRSLDRGDHVKPISPEITRTKRGTATALAESPMNADVLWAGTDDGNLWVTKDGGKAWTNVAEKVGLPGPRWVASIEPSKYVEGRAYVAFDAHRSDDDEPYVYVTEDYGQTWKSLRGNLPWGSTRVLREDIENSNLLYLGTEFGAWASPDRGKVWTKINSNLPTVAVHEFAQHPTAGEVVAATHGRSLWILDVTALRQMRPVKFKDGVVLFRPGDATRWRSEPERGQQYGMGHRRYVGENPPNGVSIYYALAAKAKSVHLKVVDYAGKTVRELEVKNEPGMHRIGWDLRRDDTGSLASGVRSVLPLFGVDPLAVADLGGFGRPYAPSGTYRVVLTVDGKTYTEPVKVENDPTLKPEDILAEPMPVMDPERKERRREGKIDD
jgi:photosystem II stability/assembly factor-like uncharacterized protein